MLENFHFLIQLFENEIINLPYRRVQVYETVQISLTRSRATRSKKKHTANYFIKPQLLPATSLSSPTSKLYTIQMNSTSRLKYELLCGTTHNLNSPTISFFDKVNVRLAVAFPSRDRTIRKYHQTPLDLYNNVFLSYQ